MFTFEIRFRIFENNNYISTYIYLTLNHVVRCSVNSIYLTTLFFLRKMTDAIEVALISDNNDQMNSVAVWDIRNGTTLMQYRGESIKFAFLKNVNKSFLCRRWSCW